jgi:hypothetical protein
MRAGLTTWPSWTSSSRARCRPAHRRRRRPQPRRLITGPHTVTRHQGDDRKLGQTPRYPPNLHPIGGLIGVAPMPRPNGWSARRADQDRRPGFGAHGKGSTLRRVAEDSLLVRKGAGLLGFVKSSGPANPEARRTRLGEDRSRRTFCGRLRPVRLFGRRVLGATLAGRPVGGGGGSCVSSSASTSWRCRVVA